MFNLKSLIFLRSSFFNILNKSNKKFFTNANTMISSGGLPNKIKAKKGNIVKRKINLHNLAKSKEIQEKATSVLGSLKKLTPETGVNKNVIENKHLQEHFLDQLDPKMLSPHSFSLASLLDSEKREKKLEGGQPIEIQWLKNKLLRKKYSRHQINLMRESRYLKLDYVREFPKNM
jgi:hypothetical protein